MVLPLNCSFRLTQCLFQGDRDYFHSYHFIKIHPKKEQFYYHRRVKQNVGIWSFKGQIFSPGPTKGVRSRSGKVNRVWTTDLWLFGNLFNRFVILKLVWLTVSIIWQHLIWTKANALLIKSNVDLTQRGRSNRVLIKLQAFKKDTYFKKKKKLAVDYFWINCLT